MKGLLLSVWAHIRRSSRAAQLFGLVKLWATPSGSWGEEILAYHIGTRATNGPIEGINNLLQILRRVAHGFTNTDNVAARGPLVT